MTLNQFNNLKIGDIVMNANCTAEVAVMDINRNRGLVNTGGAWRKYTTIRFPKEKELPSEFTRLPKVTHMTFSVKMINKFSLVESAIIHTILRAGEDGFVGTNESLCEASQICASTCSANIVIPRLCKARIITRDNLAYRVTRFRINMNAVEEYL